MVTPKLPKDFSEEEIELLDRCPLLLRVIEASEYWYASYKLVGDTGNKLVIYFHIPSSINNFTSSNFRWSSLHHHKISSEQVFDLLSDEEKMIMIFYMDIFR